MQPFTILKLSDNLQKKDRAYRSYSAYFMSNLIPGDTVLSHFALYGGTNELFKSVLAQAGIKTTIINMRDLNEVEDALKKDPSIKLIHVETPANPTLQCIDLAGISELAKKYGAVFTVDNTFATPYLQQPFKYGADFVFHSTHITIPHGQPHGTDYRYRTGDT